MGKKVKAKVILFIIILIIVFNLFIYAFDRSITPTVLVVADAEMRAKCMEIINNTIINEYSKQFKYEDIVRIEKDKNDNIVMLKADTLKMNKIACDVAIIAQKELKGLGSVGIKVPMGYILKNNILANLGPSITFKMQPIGYIETKYLSEFESAGINQTRHKVYVSVKTKIRVIIPMRSNDIEIKSEMPISETIIVGKIPNTSVNLDLQNAGYKLNNTGGNE